MRGALTTRALQDTSDVGDDTPGDLGDGNQGIGGEFRVDGNPSDLSESGDSSDLGDLSDFGNSDVKEFIYTRDLGDNGDLGDDFGDISLFDLRSLQEGQCQASSATTSCDDDSCQTLGRTSVTLIYDGQPIGEQSIQIDALEVNLDDQSQVTRLYAKFEAVLPSTFVIGDWQMGAEALWEDSEEKWKLACTMSQNDPPSASLNLGGGSNGESSPSFKFACSNDQITGYEAIVFVQNGAPIGAQCQPMSENPEPIEFIEFEPEQLEEGWSCFLLAEQGSFCGDQVPAEQELSGIAATVFQQACLEFYGNEICPATDGFWQPYNEVCDVEGGEGSEFYSQNFAVLQCGEGEGSGAQTFEAPDFQIPQIGAVKDSSSLCDNEERTAYVCEAQVQATLTNMNAFLESLGAGKGEKSVRMSYLLRDDFGDESFQESGKMSLQALQTNDDEAENGGANDDEANDGEANDGEAGNDVPDNGAADDEGDTETQDTRLLWSKTSTWKGQTWYQEDDPRRPQNDDSVVIPANKHVLYDMDKSPVLDTLTVQGTLSFETCDYRVDQNILTDCSLRQDVILQAGSIIIENGGAVYVGTDQDPIEYKAELILQNNDQSKGILEVKDGGTLKMYGLPRTNSSDKIKRVTRMSRDIDPRDGVGESIQIADPNLSDVKPGDMLGLPAYDFNPLHSQTVKAGTNSGGQFTTVVNIKDSTLLPVYRGGQLAFDNSFVNQQGSAIDRRQEVLLLSSNVRINCKPNPNGCQLNITNDLQDDGVTIFNSHTVVLDNVEFLPGGLEENGQAAVNIVDARGQITFHNSTIHTCPGLGVAITRSGGIDFSNNVIHDVGQIGIIAIDSGDTKIDGNFVNGVKPFQLVNQEENNACRGINFRDICYIWEGSTGGIMVKDTRAQTDQTFMTPVKVTNNIVASVWHAGYALPPGESCDEWHTGNIAHSIAGYGLIVQPPRFAQQCSYFSHFTGYKNTLATMHFGGGVGSRETRIDNIVSFDSGVGLIALGGTDDGVVTVQNSIFYDGFEDIYSTRKGDGLYIDNKIGVWVPFYGKHATSIQKAENNLNAIEFAKMHTGSLVWGGASQFYNNKFVGDNQQGRFKAIGFERYSHSAAYLPPTSFVNTEFRIISRLAQIIKPTSGQSNTECDNDRLLCDDPNNIQISFKNNKFTDDQGDEQDPLFTQGYFTSNTSPLSCQSDNGALGNYCPTESELGTLLFEPKYNVDDVSTAEVTFAASQESSTRLLYNNQPSCDEFTVGRCSQNQLSSVLDLSRASTYTIGSSEQIEDMRIGLYTGAIKGQKEGITISLPADSLTFQEYKVYKITDFDPFTRVQLSSDRLEPDEAFTDCGQIRKNEFKFYLKKNCTIELEGQVTKNIDVVVNTGSRRRLNEGNINYEDIASTFGVAVEDVAVRNVVQQGDSLMFTVVIMAAPNAVDPTTGLTALEKLAQVEENFLVLVASGDDSLAGLGGSVEAVLTEDGAVVPTPGNEDLSSLTSNAAFLERFAEVQRQAGCAEDQREQVFADNAKALQTLAVDNADKLQQMESGHAADEQQMAADHIAAEAALKLANAAEMERVLQENEAAEEQLKLDIRQERDQLKAENKAARKQLKADNEKREDEMKQGNLIAEKEQRDTNRKAEKALKKTDKKAAKNLRKQNQKDEQAFAKANDQAEEDLNEQNKQKEDAMREQQQEALKALRKSQRAAKKDLKTSNDAEEEELKKKHLSSENSLTVNNSAALQALQDSNTAEEDALRKQNTDEYSELKATTEQAEAQLMERCAASIAFAESTSSVSVGVSSLTAAFEKQPGVSTAVQEMAPSAESANSQTVTHDMAEQENDINQLGQIIFLVLIAVLALILLSFIAIYILMKQRKQSGSIQLSGLPEPTAVDRVGEASELPNNDTKVDVSESDESGKKFSHVRAQSFDLLNFTSAAKINNHTD